MADRVALLVELYYQHRVPASIPVEDVAEVMGELIAEGKIRGWGQSQLTDQEFARIEAELTKIEIHGNRTDEDIAKLAYLD